MHQGWADAGESCWSTSVSFRCLLRELPESMHCLWLTIWGWLGSASWISNHSNVYFWNTVNKMEKHKTGRTRMMHLVANMQLWTCPFQFTWLIRSCHKVDFRVGTWAPPHGQALKILTSKGCSTGRKTLSLQWGDAGKLQQPHEYQMRCISQQTIVSQKKKDGAW